MSSHFHLTMKNQLYFSTLHDKTYYFNTETNENRNIKICQRESNNGKKSVNFSRPPTGNDHTSQNSVCSIASKFIRLQPQIRTCHDRYRWWYEPLTIVITHRIIDSVMLFAEISNARALTYTHTILQYESKMTEYRYCDCGLMVK